MKRLLVGILGVATAACSGSSSPADGGPDAGCANVTVGARVPIVVDSGSPQDWAGGTIASGTYALTAYTFYDDGCSFIPGGTDAVTLVFTPSVNDATAGAVQTALDQVSLDGTHLSASEAGTYVTLGANLSITETCPSQYTAPTYQYTATPNTLTVWSQDAGCGAYLQVFQRQ